MALVASRFLPALAYPSEDPSADERAWRLLEADLPPAEAKLWSAATFGQPSKSRWMVHANARDGSRWGLTSDWVGMLRLIATPPAGWEPRTLPQKQGWAIGTRLCVRLVDDETLPMGDQVVGLRRLLQACPEVVYAAANIVGDMLVAGDGSTIQVLPGRDPRGCIYNPDDITIRSRAAAFESPRGGGRQTGERP